MRAVVTRTSGAGDHEASDHCHCAETQIGYCKLLISKKCSLVFLIMIMWILNNSDTSCLVSLLTTESVVLYFVYLE